MTSQSNILFGIELACCRGRRSASASQCCDANGSPAGCGTASAFVAIPLDGMLSSFLLTARYILRSGVGAVYRAELTGNEVMEGNNSETW